MYTIQALWSMARENLLHVVSVIFNNASYSVLNVELERVGALEKAGKTSAKSQFGDLKGPVLNLDGAQLAQGMGIPACGARQHGRGLLPGRWSTHWRTPGPHLIEALVPESLSRPQRRCCPVVPLAAQPAFRRPGGARSRSVASEQDCAVRQQKPAS